MSKNLEKMQNYANAIYQNAMVGIQSVRDIEDKVEKWKKITFLKSQGFGRP